MKIKKILAVILALVTCFAFAGCKEEKKETNDPVSMVEPVTHSALNIVALAEKGEIPEINYALGADVEDLKETFMDHVEEGSEIYELKADDHDNYVSLDGGSVTFYYKKGKKSKGISVIAAKESAYEFTMGGVYDADDVILAVGLDEYERAEATEEDAFFLPGFPEGTECIKYTINNYELRFILIDGYLSAVSLTNPEYWDYN